MSDLLEILQERAGCPYLSDLHSDRFRPQALRELLSLPPDAFSLRQWQEAACYLLDRKENLTSVEEIRARLKESF